MKLHIRWMIRRDLPAVLEIERQSFAEPWTEADFLAAMRQRNVIGMVAEIGDRIVGFMLYELRTRSIRLSNLAVTPDFRRSGVGRAMVEKLKIKLQGHQRVRLATTVRESNLDGLLFFRSVGLRANRSIRDFFPGGESAIEMSFSAAGEAVRS